MAGLLSVTLCLLLASPLLARPTLLPTQEAASDACAEVQGRLAMEGTSGTLAGPEVRRRLRGCMLQETLRTLRLQMALQEQAERLRHYSRVLPTLPAFVSESSPDTVTASRRHAKGKRSFIRVGKLPQAIYLHMIRSQQQQQGGDSAETEREPLRLYDRSQVVIAG